MCSMPNSLFSGSGDLSLKRGKARLHGLPGCRRSGLVLILPATARAIVSEMEDDHDNVVFKIIENLLLSGLCVRIILSAC